MSDAMFNVDFGSKPMQLIGEMADRCIGLCLAQDARPPEKIDITISLSCCSEVDYEKLNGFSNFDFAHDVSGIMHNINHETLELDNCFVPRASW